MRPICWYKAVSAAIYALALAVTLGCGSGSEVYQVSNTGNPESGTTETQSGEADSSPASAPSPDKAPAPSSGDTGKSSDTGSTPPTDGGSTPPSDGGSTPPSDGGSTPPSDGGSTPPSGGGSTPPSDGGSTPPSDGGSTPPSDGGTTPSDPGKPGNGNGGGGNSGGNNSDDKPPGKPGDEKPKPGDGKPDKGTNGPVPESKDPNSARSRCADLLGIPVEHVKVAGNESQVTLTSNKALVINVTGNKADVKVMLEGEVTEPIQGVCVFIRGNQPKFHMSVKTPVKSLIYRSAGNQSQGKIEISGAGKITSISAVLRGNSGELEITGPSGSYSCPEEAGKSTVTCH